MPAGSAARRQITLERVYKATLQEVWDMWATPEGLEAWWGPEGFTVKVKQMDLRPGGSLLYTMTATGPAQIAFIKNAGMPLTQELTIHYTEVAPLRRLAYIHLADFIPGLEPYEVATSVDLAEVPDGIRMVLKMDAMHDETWTQRAVMGWESELGKLAQALAGKTR